MEIEQMLMQEGESVEAWLKRLDGKGKRLERKNQVVDPEVLKPPVKIAGKRGGCVDVNRLMAETLESDGTAAKVLGELIDKREPSVAGRSLATVASPRYDTSRLKVVTEALLSGMGPTSQAIIREVCPRGKKWRREYPEATKPFAELPGGTQGTVIDRVILRLEPEVKRELVKHPIGDSIFALQAPIRERIRKMVQEKNDPFLTG